MRHVCQEEKDLMKQDYKKRNETTLSDCNTQENEIDANAFAMVILFNVLGIVPSFENSDQTAITKIKAREKELS